MCDELAEVLKLEGFAVEKVYDGIEGKRMVESKDYSVVLLDLKLPGFGGSDLLRYIKRNCSAKVIVMTGKPLRSELYGDLEQAGRGDLESLKMADGFAEKPFDIDKILDSVRKLSTGKEIPPGGAHETPDEFQSGA